MLSMPRFQIDRHFCSLISTLLRFISLSYCVEMLNYSVSLNSSPSPFVRHTKRIKLTFVQQMSHKIIIKTDNPCDQQKYKVRAHSTQTNVTSELYQVCIMYIPKIFNIFRVFLFILNILIL